MLSRHLLTYEPHQAKPHRDERVSAGRVDSAIIAFILIRGIDDGGAAPNLQPQKGGARLELGGQAAIKDL